MCVCVHHGVKCKCCISFLWACDVLLKRTGSISELAQTSLWGERRLQEWNQWPNSTNYSHDCCCNGVEMGTSHVDPSYTSRPGAQLKLRFISFQLWIIFFPCVRVIKYLTWWHQGKRFLIFFYIDESTILPASPVDKHNTRVQFSSTNNDSSGPVCFQPLLLWSWVMC